MITDSILHAQTRFDTLWEQAQTTLKTGDIQPAVMVNGHTDPIDFCLSSISRIEKQANAPLEALQKLIHELQSTLPDQFYYPLASLHVSLLGFTPRLPSKDAFTPERIERIRQFITPIMQDANPVKMGLRGVGLIGNQVFVQVFPQDDAWAVLRQKLEDALIAAGESPLSYADKRPVHLNVMRVTQAEKLELLAAFIAQNRTRDMGELNITNVEYLLTDFVVSDRTIYQDFALSPR